MTSTAARPSPTGTVTATLLGSLAALTVAAYAVLPGTIRVHWSLGGPYTGPETLPKLLGLGAIPLTAVVVVAVLFALRRASVVPRDAVDSRVYRLTVAGVLALLALCQLLLVGLNVAL